MSSPGPGADLVGHVLGQGEVHLEGDEVLLGAVVEVALEAAALLVLGRHEPLTRGPELVEAVEQLGRESQVAHHEAGLAGEVFDQLFLGWTELFRSGHAHGEGAEELALVAYGHGVGHVGQWRERDTGGDGFDLRGRGAVGRPRRRPPQFLAHLQPHVGPSGARALAQELGHARQQLVGRHALGHLGRELRQHLIGAGPGAVDQAIDEALHPLAGGGEGDGDDERGRDRQPEIGVLALPDEAADADDDGDVDDRHEAGQQRVDERAADEAIDAPQPVAEDADQQGQRHEEEHGLEDPEEGDGQHEQLAALELGRRRAAGDGECVEADEHGRHEGPEEEPRLLALDGVLGPAVAVGLGGEAGRRREEPEQRDQEHGAVAAADA